MLLWINGPFGGGKTQTAHELRRRLPTSVICDPEQVGFGLQRMAPAALRADFQDYSAWRLGVFEVLDQTLDADPAAVVIAPMTLVEPTYFAEIVDRLRERGHDVRHFALLARRETVLRRLRERALARPLQMLAGGRRAGHRGTFAQANLDRCLTRLQEPVFADQIWTDALPIPRVADQIAAATGLRLRPNTDSPLRGRARRAVVGVRHLRLG